MPTEAAEVFITYPDTDGWKPLDLVRDVLDLKKATHLAGQYGPYIIVLSEAWRPYLSMSWMPEHNADKSLEDRLLDIAGISDVTTTSGLTGWTICIYSMIAVGK